MRNGTPNRRSRGRGGANAQRKSGGNQRTQVFDSNGPDVRIRGTAHQVCEKYLALAKDAASGGDQILAESYMQHAEHYQRVIGSWDIENINSGQPLSQSQKQTREKQEKQMQQDVSGNKITEDEDLSLPNSILGSGVKVDSEVEGKRTEKRTEQQEAFV